MVMTKSTLKKRQQKNGGYEGGIRVLRKAFKPLPSKVLALLVITLFHYFQLDDVCSYRIGADEVVIWLVMKWAFSLFSGGYIYWFAQKMDTSATLLRRGKYF